MAAYFEYSTAVTVNAIRYLQITELFWLELNKIIRKTCVFNQYGTAHFASETIQFKKFLAYYVLDK